MVVMVGASLGVQPFCDLRLMYLFVAFLALRTDGTLDPSVTEESSRRENCIRMIWRAECALASLHPAGCVRFLSAIPSAKTPAKTLPSLRDGASGSKDATEKGTRVRVTKKQGASVAAPFPEVHWSFGLVMD